MRRSLEARRARPVHRPRRRRLHAGPRARAEGGRDGVRATPRRGGPRGGEPATTRLPWSSIGAPSRSVRALLLEDEDAYDWHLGERRRIDEHVGRDARVVGESRARGTATPGPAPMSASRFSSESPVGRRAHQLLMEAYCALRQDHLVARQYGRLRRPPRARSRHQATARDHAHLRATDAPPTRRLLTRPSSPLTGASVNPRRRPLIVFQSSVLPSPQSRHSRPFVSPARHALPMHPPDQGRERWQRSRAPRRRPRPTPTTRTIPTLTTPDPTRPAGGQITRRDLEATDWTTSEATSWAEIHDREGVEPSTIIKEKHPFEVWCVIWLHGDIWNLRLRNLVLRVPLRAGQGRKAHLPLGHPRGGAAE